MERITWNENSNTIMIKKVESVRPIKDEAILKEVITFYHRDQFLYMKKYINGYKADYFFRDLWEFLSNYPARHALNKYLLFVGITLQYHKEY